MILIESGPSRWVAVGISVVAVAGPFMWGLLSGRRRLKDAEARVMEARELAEVQRLAELIDRDLPAWLT